MSDYTKGYRDGLEAAQELVIAQKHRVESLGESPRAVDALKTSIELELKQIKD